MKVNREKFLAAALLLSTATGCDKLGLKGKETAKAAPEIAMSAQQPDPVAPAAEGDPKPATPAGHAVVIPKNMKAKVGVGGPANEGVVAPNNEGVIAPGKEAIAPNNEGVVAPNNEGVIPAIAPANENIPAPGQTAKIPTGKAPVIPGGKARGVR